MADFLATPATALAAALLTTALAAWESRRAPWAPFLLVYAVALPAFPLAAATFSFGPFGAAFAVHAPGIAALSAAILAWEILVAGHLYETRLLSRLGRRNDRLWSPARAMDDLLAGVARKTGWPPGRVEAVYGIYFLVWAPVAEELFFWGYLYPLLRDGAGIAAAAAATSLAFGIRHGLHFLFLAPPFPWGAATAFSVSTAGSAALNCALFELSGSLWPLILLHLASNLAAGLQQAFRKN